MLNIKDTIRLSLPKNNIAFLILRVLFSPVTTIFLTPFIFFKTIYNSRTLIHEKWIKYPHFAPETSFVSVFYWSAIENLFRYGLKGRTKYMGNGNFHLSHFFYHTFLSLHFYKVAGAFMLLSCMLFWIFAQFIWLFNPEVEASILTLILTFALGSSTFYGLTFCKQNYNVLGWVFFPIIIFALYNNCNIVLLLFLILISFGSFTATFISCLISTVFFILTGKIHLLILIVPTILKILIFHIMPCRKELRKIVIRIISTISGRGKKIKYKRSKTSKEILGIFYYTILYLQFIIISYLFLGEIDLILLLAFFIFILNNLIFRFADYQSIYTMMATICIASSIINFCPQVLISLLIVLNPLPILIGFDKIQGVFEIPKVLKPFDISEIFDSVEEFILMIPKEETLTMNFNNPHGDYGKIFDGLNSQREVFGYIATKHKRLFYPDSYCVYQDNSNELSKNIVWGRENEQIHQLLDSTKANYTIFYSKIENGHKAIKANKLIGFKCISTFDWGKFEDNFSFYNYEIKKDQRYWHLMRRV